MMGVDRLVNCKGQGMKPHRFRTRRYALYASAAASVAVCWAASAEQFIVEGRAIQVEGNFVVQPGGGAVVVQNLQFGGPMIAVPGEGGFFGRRTDGFQVAAGGVAIEDTAAAEAMKHLQDKDWFQAIASIEALGESGDNQMVTDPTGVLRPVSSLRRSLLEALPEEGRQTFRRLNGPAAEAKLAEAMQIGSLDERALALESVLSKYALCDAAADAASRLGDLRFEAGRFDEAADLYRRAAEHPGSTPDDPRLMAKRLYALARAEQWQQLGTLAEYAAFRHPQASVEIGGRPVALPELARSLAQGSGQANQPTRGMTRSELPAESYPTYSIKLTDESTDLILQNAAMSNRFGGQIENLLHPAVVAGPGRFYSLHMDTVSAFDAATGSRLWTDGDIRINAGQLTGNFHYLQMDYQQQALLHEDTLLIANTDPQSMNWSRLRAIDVKTGEVSWNSKSIGAIQQFSFVGRPLVVGDKVICAARENAGNELKLVAISIANGGLAWAMNLGTATPDPQWNQPVDVTPRLAMGERYLMVLTNNGGVLAVDVDTQAIAWAFTFPVLPTNRVRRGGFDIDPPGNIVTHRGVVYFKDTRDSNVHAIREYDATRLWSVPVDRDDTIVHCDARFVYTLGEQVVAIDQQTGKRQWWSPHAGDEAGRPVFTDNDMLVMGRRLSCRIDLDDGKVTAFRKDLSGAGYRGGIVQTGQMLGFADRNWVRVYRMPLSQP